MDEIKTAIRKGHQSLSEFQSKKLLDSYGVPITREKLAGSMDDAVSYAGDIGYPVALKACSHALMHKSENDCIRLNLKTAQEVIDAYHHIIGAVDMALEGVLVQEMVAGQRELVMGMNRDPRFGPCVMLGIGGIMTEIINDTVFRVAPFNRREAMDMIHELRLKKMLEGFRGQAPADLETITHSLLAIGNIGIDFSGISEIDVNPLIIDKEGRITAVDALVILERDE